jgi:hypothetical protein
VQPVVDGFVAGFATPLLVNVPTDGPDNVFVPETAAQWAALGIPEPDSEWLMQGAGPNMADIFGGITLVPLAGAALTYGVAVAGWDGDFVSYPNVANTGFELASASYNPALDSAACLVYAEVINAPAIRQFIHLGTSATGVGAGGQLARIQAAGAAETRNDGVSTGGAYIYEADSIVHPFLLRFRRGAPDLGSLNLFTDREQIIGAVDLTSVNTTDKGFNGQGGSVALTSRYRLGAWWYGDAKIALLGKATLEALRWPLFY